jgi:uncharacterized protein YndB with AHSA1/START domain
MQKLHFSIKINAPAEKVWNTMLGEETYKDWTSVFNEGGSTVRGNWEKGSKMLFIGPDPETGEEGGMVSMIAENMPHKFISIEHIGIWNNGVEDTTSDFAKSWTPSFENYTFKEENGVTEVSVDIDMMDEYVEMFEEMWPKSLERLKELAEEENKV